MSTERNPLAREPDSFDPDDRMVGTGPRGQRAHRLAIEHDARLARKLWRVGEHVWCLVGNGLSNQVFVEGPEGVIAIDTGECVEEMAAALRAFRTQCERPVVAVIYSHFHYVGGTAALKDDAHTRWADVQVWCHRGVLRNRQRVAGEVSATIGRGLIHQMGILLPPEGEDGLLHLGLGRFYRNPEHAPFTQGFVAPTHTFDTPTRTRLAGLDVELTPAPSDADDSVTIWFPALGVCVNNLVWPALFNIFPIRGEPYRDPIVIVEGVDHIRSLPVQHLVATHGPPISGAGEVAQALVDYRDSIQFLWDQTVRGLNRGLTGPELARFVRLPARFERSYLTRQLYGLVEHHVRQIRSGLVGWFDGDESTLFALATGERAARLIAGFGGRDAVRAQARAALEAQDLRWALELGCWLVRADADAPAALPVGAASADDRALLADALRRVAYRTPAANLRNWCLTRARELEGRLDLARFRRHRFRAEDVLGAPAGAFVATLRVLLDPETAEGVDDELAWHFDDGTVAGLALRGQVAVPTDGRAATLAIRLSLATWAALLSGRQTLADAIASGSVQVDGDARRVVRMLACFDVPAFAGGRGA
jgi:alkyl sulfatase BDS1-like metallo-beta-lactamase superfamily hydrolase